VTKRLATLTNTLTILASDAGEQLGYLAKIEVPVSIDELALDFDAIACSARDMLQKGELNENQFECIKELNYNLKGMSGPHNSHLWTAEALYTAAEWRHVRNLANHCLTLLGTN
jgi:hypothetical protein